MSNLASNPSYKPVISLKQVPTVQPSYVSSLILDRLSLTVKISAENASYARLYFESLHDIAMGLSIKKNEEKWITAGLVLPSATGGDAFAHIEVNTQTQGKPYFRLDYNPASLSTEGMDMLEKLLREVTPFDGLADMLKTATITRIDLARDLYGRPFKERLYTAIKFHVGSAAFTNKDGLVQQVFGSSSSSRVSFYDKSEGGVHRVRTEYRCKKRMSISEVAGLPNLFDRVRIYEQYVFSQFGIPPQLLPVFLDSCRCWGLKATFKLWKENLNFSALTQQVLNELPQLVWPQWKASHETWPQQLLEALVHHRLYEPPSTV